jgi:hypothetical protein
MLALTDSALAPLCHLRHGPRPGRRHALELLAASREGATEAIMIATASRVEFAAHRNDGAKSEKNPHDR